MPEPLHILQISPRIPWPVTDGSAIGIYNITRSVAARGHRVTFVAFGNHGGGRTEGGRTEGREDGEAKRRVGGTGGSESGDGAPQRAASHDEHVRASRSTNDMPTFCELILVPHDTSNSPWRVVRNLFSRDPYPVSKYDCAAMFAKLDELCTARRFDVVHVDHAHMAMYGEYVQRKYGLPYVLREHNFETTIYRRYVEQARLPLVRQYWSLQARRLYRYETHAVSFPEVVAAITQEDAADIERALGRQDVRALGRPHVLTSSRPHALTSSRPHALTPSRTTIIPAGVDCARTRPFADPPDDNHIVIVGPLTWAPNVDAAAWFVDEVWPRILKEEPEVRCTIAGASPPARLKARESARLRFPGFVEDYEDLLRRATVLAVPLRIGGGMRIKLLEFFAHAKAVVSTGVGAEGNAGRPGEDYLRADTAAEFAAAVLALLRDATRRAALGASARAMVERVYSWERIGEQFEKAYVDAIALRDAARGQEQRSA